MDAAAEYTFNAASAEALICKMSLQSTPLSMNSPITMDQQNVDSTALSRIV